MYINLSSIVLSLQIPEKIVLLQQYCDKFEVVFISLLSSLFENSHYSGDVRSNLWQYMLQDQDESGRRCYKCSLCNQTPSLKSSNMLNHIESVHFPFNSYQCPYCPKKLKSLNAYNVHTSRHKKSFM